MKITFLTFALAIAFGLIGGCSEVRAAAVLGVWADSTGRTIEITPDKWIAKSMSVPHSITGLRRPVLKVQMSR